MPKRTKSKRSAKKIAKKKTPAAAPQSEVISADLAKQVLRADMARIIKKAKDGLPLTPAERSLLERISNGASGDQGSAPSEVPSIAALCGILGITRVTFYAWKKKFPQEIPKNGPNGNYHVESWRSFAAKRGLKGAIEEAAEDDDDMEALKRRDVRARALTREFNLAVARREYFAKDVVQEMIGKLVGEAVKILRDRLENELPPVCAGLDAPRIRKETSAVVDEICTLLHAGLDLDHDE